MTKATAAAASAAALAIAASAPAEAAAPAVAASEPTSGIDSTGRPWKAVTLDNPVKRAGVSILRVTVRKPMAGDLRGTELAKVYNADVGSMTLILPRITEPTIHKQELNAMDGEDFAALSGEVVNFLLPRSARTEAGLDE